MDLNEIINTQLKRLMPTHVWYAASNNEIYIISPEVHNICLFLRKVYGAKEEVIYLGEL